MELYELVPPPIKREAPIVQLYHPSVAEQVAASGMAVVMNEVPKELKLAYNDKLAEYKDVSAKLLRHKLMNPAALQVYTERFMDMIQELSVMLNEVDAIREHTLEEAMGGFAV